MSLLNLSLKKWLIFQNRNLFVKHLLKNSYKIGTELSDSPVLFHVTFTTIPGYEHHYYFFPFLKWENWFSSHTATGPQSSDLTPSMVLSIAAWLYNRTGVSTSDAHQNTWGGTESRWWRSRRTWSSFLPTNASRLHLQMEQFSQSTCWTLTEDLGHLKGQERSPYNQVG